MKKTIAIIFTAVFALTLTAPAAASEVNSVHNSTRLESVAAISEPALDLEQTPSALIFGTDISNSSARLGEAVLKPGVEYKFPVHVRLGDQTSVLTPEIMKGYKFSYSRVGSNGVQRFEIEDERGVYYLFVQAKTARLTQPVEVDYNVKLINKENNLAIFTQDVSFRYGYDESSADYISALERGDAVEIDSERPVITKSQFEKIAKLNNYKDVTLSGEGWAFTASVTDEDTKNFLSDNEAVKAILRQFPEQEFKFFNFSEEPSFKSSGLLRLDVGDIADSFDEMYVYRYTDGVLHKASLTPNSDDTELVIRAVTLDSFVVTDKQIPDGFVVGEGGADASEIGDDEISVTDVNGAYTDDTLESAGVSDEKGVPETGAYCSACTGSGS